MEHDTRIEFAIIWECYTTPVQAAFTRTNGQMVGDHTTNCLKRVFLKVFLVGLSEYFIGGQHYREQECDSHERLGRLGNSRSRNVATL